MKLKEDTHINIENKPIYNDHSRREYLLREIYNLLVNGATSSNIIDRLMNDYWNVGKKYTHKSCYNLLEDARKMIKEDFEEDRKTLKEQIYANYMDIYAEARESFDRMAAIKCMENLAKITGLNEPTKVEAKVDGSIVIDFGLDNDNEETEV